MVRVKVKAIANDVFDDGVHHPKGEIFEMEQSLVKSHVDAGQIEIVTDKGGSRAKDKR